jgi:hypothetical protein
MRLAAMGIACQIRSEDPGPLFAATAGRASACLHEVWVGNDADFERAVRALDETAVAEPEPEPE